MRHALVDQPGFFPAGNNIDGEPQNLMRLDQKLVSVASLSQSLSGHSSDLRFFESRQPLAESGQAIPAALHGVLRQVSFGIQAIPLTYGFFKIFRAVDLAPIKPADFQAKTVRAQIHSRQQSSILHTEVYRFSAWCSSTAPQKKRRCPAKKYKREY